MISTVAIAFNGGAYGTYLHWCLHTLTSDCPIVSPFTSVGNSHGFKGLNLVCPDNMYTWIRKGDHRLDFIRFHPKTTKRESIPQVMEKILDHLQHSILLYPDSDTMLLNINNYYSKIWDDWWIGQLQNIDHFDFNHILDQWNMPKNTNIKDVPIWIKREWLSYYLVPAWKDQVEWYLPDQWSHSRCSTVTLSDLLFDFERTLLQIESHCGLRYVKDIDCLKPYHQQNLSLQTHIGQDQLCEKIVDQVLQPKATDWQWPMLPLPSEAWIQWELRNRGFEIHCHDLDEFPTNLHALRKIIYRS